METKIITRQLLTSAPMQCREADDGKRTISGYAILFDTESAALYEDETDEVREIIAPEAVTRELLDSSDIKMTMFHDRQLILARSNKGQGTLSYTVDSTGVGFSFEVPNTADGQKAYELVGRGDIAGCSFAFTCDYYNDECVSKKKVKREAKDVTIYTVRQIKGIHDFTLAADPAYPATSCEAREIWGGKETEAPKGDEPKVTDEMRQQWAEMRKAAAKSMYN